MMNDHPSTERLHDFAEELLRDADAAAVGAHVETCAACAGEVASIRALRAELAGLPREVVPEADLRTAIRADLRRREDARVRRRVVRQIRWTLAAAAVLLVAISVTATTLVMRSPSPVAEAGDYPPNFAALEREYARAADDLLRALEAEKELIPREKLALVEENLRAVERALSETRVALSEDPGSPMLRELVLAAHRHRLDVLRRAATMPAAGS